MMFKVDILSGPFLVFYRCLHLLFFCRNRFSAVGSRIVAKETTHNKKLKMGKSSRSSLVFSPLTLQFWHCCLAFCQIEQMSPSLSDGVELPRFFFKSCRKKEMKRGQHPPVFTRCSQIFLYLQLFLSPFGVDYLRQLQVL